ncbi:MAG: DinB family protein [Crocinitomicaceae bacterium]|nr:DinB family protein [Crocinitomicaceae bacterium]
MEYNVKDAILILERTPSILNAFLRDLSDNWTRKNEGGDTWSAYDVVGHFIHGEKTDWIERADIILGKSEKKEFIPFDRFAQFKDSKGKSLNELLDEFEQLRAENIEKLKEMGLSDEKYALVGIHPDFGLVTLKELLSAWVVHDLCHLNQVSRVIAKQYTEEVGPWINYMRVLNS